MFYSTQTRTQQRSYLDLLRLVGSLSQLFSDSPTPYLYYRAAEKIFCRAFNAKDLSRSDVSADAQVDRLGIGLKTFLAKNHHSFEKVAEFNHARAEYAGLDDRALVYKIAELRNTRLDFTQRTYGLENMIYHCVIRDNEGFHLFEEPMYPVTLGKVQSIKRVKNAVRFRDDVSEYSFSLSKSTLFKRFITSESLHQFSVEVLNNPFDFLQNCLKGDLSFLGDENDFETIFLPLYGRNKVVYERSGLNQWNAKGRPRHEHEVYIPVPGFIHQYYPDFFPSRDVPFELILPSGEKMEAKICQDNGKALMSNPNKHLGEWLLNQVLGLKPRELLTYEMLEEFGVDSVRVDKKSDGFFEINFAELNSYEKFKDVDLVD